MHLSQISLATNHLAAQREFYTQTLGLPLAAAAGDSFTVRAGSSALTFAQAAAPLPAIYHFAFNIPQNQFAEAHAWAKTRLPLAADERGRDTFHFEKWDAHALYFLDPAGNIAEFIARHRLSNDTARPFDADSILNVSEIGWAALDVRATVERLRQLTGAAVYDGEGSADFTAVGDEQGLFIVARKGRYWYLTDRMPAALLPLRAVLANGITVAQSETAALFVPEAPLTLPV